MTDAKNLSILIANRAKIIEVGKEIANTMS